MTTATTDAVVYAAPVRHERRVLPAVLGTLVPVVLGTWFGGLVALILFVSTLFAQARRVAVEAAPFLFNAFERYQLAVAGAALLTAVLWRLTWRSAWTTGVVAATLAATGLAVLQIGLITPRINAARDVDHATFERFHHLASVNYTTLATLVLIGLVLAVVAGRRGRA